MKFQQGTRTRGVHHLKGFEDFGCGANTVSQAPARGCTAAMPVLLLVLLPL